MNKYRVVIDKGAEWPASSRAVNNCVICNNYISAKQDAYWIVNDSQGMAGVLRLTCSEECANMYILQNMDMTSNTRMSVVDMINWINEA